jgi:hypothetical protein
MSAARGRTSGSEADGHERAPRGRCSRCVCARVQARAAVVLGACTRGRVIVSGAGQLRVRRHA